MYLDHSIAELQHIIATSGDEKAYAELYYRFAPMLTRFAASIVHQQEVAEEIVSDVFIRVWERRHTLDQISNLRMYLYVSVRNFSINHLRGVDRQPQITLDDIQAKWMTSPEADDPQQITMDRLMRQRLLEAIKALPPKCRIIFKLTKEDGMKQKEVAELLNVTPKTVENQLAIALKKICESVRQYSDRVIRLRS